MRLCQTENERRVCVTFLGERRRRFKSAADAGTSLKRRKAPRDGRASEVEIGWKPIHATRFTEFSPIEPSFENDGGSIQNFAAHPRTPALPRRSRLAGAQTAGEHLAVRADPLRA